MNVIARLEFELAYFVVTVQYVSHYTTVTLRKFYITVCIFKFGNQRYRSLVQSHGRDKQRNLSICLTFSGQRLLWFIQIFIDCQINELKVQKLTITYFLWLTNLDIVLIQWMVTHEFDSCVNRFRYDQQITYALTFEFWFSYIIWWATPSNHSIVLGRCCGEKLLSTVHWRPSGSWNVPSIQFQIVAMSNSLFELTFQLEKFMWIILM